MEANKINLNKIFKQQNPQDGELPKWAREFCIEVCKQALELAAENANLLGETMHDNGAADEIAEGVSVFVSNGPDYYFKVNKQSIINTIKQIE